MTTSLTRSIWPAFATPKKYANTSSDAVTRQRRTYADIRMDCKTHRACAARPIDMFNQTVHVKDIQSLNSFIRTHMLEAYDWQRQNSRPVNSLQRSEPWPIRSLLMPAGPIELLVPVERRGRNTDVKPINWRI